MFRKKKYKSTTSSIGVIGSMDGPTTIILAAKEKDKSKPGFGLGFFKNFLKINGK